MGDDDVFLGVLDGRTKEESDGFLVDDLVTVTVLVLLLLDSSGLDFSAPIGLAHAWTDLRTRLEVTLALALREADPTELREASDDFVDRRAPGVPREAAPEVRERRRPVVLGRAVKGSADTGKPWLLVAPLLR